MENVASYYKFYRIPKRFFKEEQFRDMEYFWIANACQTPMETHGVMNLALHISFLQSKKL